RMLTQRITAVVNNEEPQNKTKKKIHIIYRKFLIEHKCSRKFKFKKNVFKGNY
ncbi:hypothetical protein DOY81_005322, partial [Sarcophaga bullata]